MIELYVAKTVNFSTLVGLVSEAFDSANVVSGERIIRLPEVDDTIANRNALASIISNYSYEDDLLALAQAAKVKALWEGVKYKQEQHFYDLDVVEARRIVGQGVSEDKYTVCLGIKTWIDSLFAEYYSRKDMVYAAANVEAVNNIETNFVSFEAPTTGLSKDVIWR